MLAKYSLVLQTEPEPGKAFPLGQETYSVGRERTNSITLNHPEVSRNHCLISYEDGTFFVQDLGSLNGTFLDGEKVEARQPFYPGVVLGLGGAVSAVLRVATNNFPAALAPQSTQVEQAIVEPAQDEVSSYEEPVEEIAPESFEEDGSPEPASGNSTARTMVVLLIVLLVLLVLGVVLFLWFVDYYSLWCQVLPFLFEPGVCP